MSPTYRRELRNERASRHGTEAYSRDLTPERRDRGKRIPSFHGQFLIKVHFEKSW